MELNKKRVNQQKNVSDYKKSSLNSVNLMAARLDMHGGEPQEDRMIKDKRRSFDKACLYSYQGAFIKKNPFDSFDEDIDQPRIRALINPNKLKQDYDDKIVSVGFENDFHTGDVFNWCNTNTYWLIYLQDLTELAYFRGDIRRCNYTLEWEQDGQRHKTYCAVRGPVETKINYIQKHTISIDIPNHSVNIMMPSNEYTLKYFKRYTKFYLQDGTDEHKVCWRVEAVDWISMPGILEVNGVEYYANEDEDDIEAGIVGARIEEVQDPNEMLGLDDLISGDVFIKPKVDYTYEFLGEEEGQWHIYIDNKEDIVKAVIDSENPKIITLQWTRAYSGQFDLLYNNYQKTIVVESLF